MFNKVIVAFDGSEQAMDALLLAEALTASDGELIVCCIHHYQALSARIDPTEPAIDRLAARRAVAQAASLMRRDLKTTPISLPAGNIARALQGSALRERADLIVLGSSHRGTLGRVLLGSTTEETLHGAPCAVAIAPAGFHTQDTAPLRRVAAALDPCEPVPGALAAAVSLCERSGADLRVVTVADDTVSRAETALLPISIIQAERHQAAEETLAKAVSSLPDGVPTTHEVRDGKPVEQLLDITRAVDLLVLASHGRGLLDRLTLGSVCDGVARAASCPVLVIPASKDVPREPATDRLQTIGAEGTNP